jgi:DNA polymerase zeta
VLLVRPLLKTDEDETNQMDKVGVNSKRLESPVHSENVLNKRQKVAHDPHIGSHSTLPSLEPKRRALHTAIVKPVTLATSGFVRNSPSTNKKSSQDSLKAVDKSQTQPLLFPVVKDPQDPSTIQRLSQKSASQPSPSDKTKRVSFETLSSSQDLNHRQTTMGSETQSSPARLSTPIPGVMKKMRDRFGKDDQGIVLAIREPPPSELSVVSTLPDLNLPSMIYQDAFYSNELDVPERAREWAGREFKLESLTIPYLPGFDSTCTSEASLGEKPGIIPDRIKEERFYQVQRRNCGLLSWEVAEPPPTYAEVEEWNRREIATASAKPSSRTTASPQKKDKLSQIDGPTQKNTQNQETTSVTHEAQYMSTMSLEVHVNTRGNYVPNPEEDEVQCVFWCLRSDEDGLESNGIAEGTHLGIVALSEDGSMAQKIAKQVTCEVQEESSELDLDHSYG